MKMIKCVVEHYLLQNVDFMSNPTFFSFSFFFSSAVFPKSPFFNGIKKWLTENYLITLKFLWINKRLFIIFYEGIIFVALLLQCDDSWIFPRCSCWQIIRHRVRLFWSAPSRARIWITHWVSFKPSVRTSNFKAGPLLVKIWREYDHKIRNYYYIIYYYIIY